MTASSFALAPHPGRFAADPLPAGERVSFETSMTTFQPHRASLESMISVADAQRRVLAEVRLLGTERVSIAEAHRRILREDIGAGYDVPQADNSAMDGYAVRAADVAEAPTRLTVIEDLPAGSVAQKRVAPGTAIRIMTGAPIPDGADAVVPVELTDGGSESLEVRRAVKAGANIRRRGEDMRRGEVVIRSGALLGAAEMGVLATTQRTTVVVSQRPTVAILSTGDEVIAIDAPIRPGKVVNSNSYSLGALAEEAGGIRRMFDVVADQHEATVKAIEAAMESNFVVTSGGVSVGAYDFVKDALDTLGAETKFWQVAMKPGKPVVLSRLRDRLFFGLPGNPVSCMVSFILFVAPAMRQAMGATQVLPPTVRIRTAAVLKSRGDRASYHRVEVVARNGELMAVPRTAQGSGVSTSMIGANGFAIVPEGVKEIAAEELVEVVLFGRVSFASAVE
jgi:molybdopterin molybdotransferase